MFIRLKYSGYEGSSQAAAGDFMILCLPVGRSSNYLDAHALVRYVKMKQMGHWMMGNFNAFGYRLIVSGSYGADGLIMRDVPQELYDRAIPVPAELMEMWARGDGWNGAGSEGPSMRKWALKTFPPTKRMRSK